VAFGEGVGPGSHLRRVTAASRHRALASGRVSGLRGTLVSPVLTVIILSQLGMAEEGLNAPGLVFAQPREVMGVLLWWPGETWEG